MSKRTDAELLGDIREAIQRVRDYTAGMDYTEFAAGTKTQDAVVRNIEIAGEAAKHLSEQVRRRYPHMPWKQMAGARDRLIHHYFGVNIDIVWQIADAELPMVQSILERIVPDERGS